MNKNLSDLVESNIQSSSQLRINKPSDDPVGAGRVITYRASLSGMAQYTDNISQASGWLSSADSVLSSSGSVQEILTAVKTLAQQGATGTYDATNREQISYALRQHFQQLINLANSSYAGKYIFSGQKTGSPAFAEGLAVTCVDSGSNLTGVNFTAEGSAQSTTLIQALTTDTAENASYRYTTDGGKTWTDISASDITLDYPETGRMRITAGGASVIMDMGVTVTAVDTENSNSTDNGTWLYIRPTAIYKGDDNDTQVVIPYGSTTNTAADVSASGNFTRDTAVRIDANDGTTITYSYSLDDGATWKQGTASAVSPALLPVSGGYLSLANAPAAGEQYIISPHRADINLAISATDSITVNLVGKDVFGGLYADPATGELNAVDNGGNLFEVIGNLIAAAETNNQEGMAQALDELTNVMNVVLSKAALVGGRENRLSFTESALTLRQMHEEDRMSSIEDVDVTVLMTKLAQQELAYSSVLKSSSMIMQMSLVDYI